MFNDSSSKINKGYEKLKSLDEERQSILNQTKNYTDITILFSWKNTLLPKILQDFTFWFAIGVYFLARWYEINFYPLTVISMTPVSITGGFISFLLVFFVSQIEKE